MVILLKQGWTFLLWVPRTPIKAGPWGMGYNCFLMEKWLYKANPHNQSFSCPNWFIKHLSTCRRRLSAFSKSLFPLSAFPSNFFHHVLLALLWKFENLTLSSGQKQPHSSIHALVREVSAQLVYMPMHREQSSHLCIRSWLLYWVSKPHMTLFMMILRCEKWRTRLEVWRYGLSIYSATDSLCSLR